LKIKNPENRVKCYPEADEPCNGILVRWEGRENLFSDMKNVQYRKIKGAGIVSQRYGMGTNKKYKKNMKRQSARPV